MANEGRKDEARALLFGETKKYFENLRESIEKNIASVRTVSQELADEADALFDRIKTGIIERLARSSGEGEYALDLLIRKSPSALSTATMPLTTAKQKPASMPPLSAWLTR